MTYKEAQPFLKDGMTVKLTKHRSNTLWRFEWQEKPVQKIIQSDFGDDDTETDDAILEEGDELEILTNPDGTPWVHPDKQKFKVGDKVRIIRTNWTGIMGNALHKIGYIQREIDGEFRWTVNTNKDGSNYLGIYNDGDLEKIEDEPKYLRFRYDNFIFDEFQSFGKPFMGWDLGSLENGSIIKFKSTNEPKAQKTTTIMSSIINKIKDLQLSADDRILRKHGLENEDGKMTEEAEDLMDDEMRDERWAKRRSEIAESLREVERTEKN